MGICVPCPEGLPLDRTAPWELSNDRLEDAMTKSPLEQSGWSRRWFIQASTAAAGLGLMPRLASAQAPWAVRPSGNPPSVTFVVWQYGNIYQQIAQQFEQDWGVKINQIIEPNVEPQVAKLTAMYAAGDAVDVSLSPMQYLASYIEQGIAQPIDGLPGVDQYVKDFTPFTRAIAQRDGKTWGLPYFSTVWTFIYNAELLAKAGFKDKPFKSYPELIEQARKAKKDGVSKYPILWVAGAGFEQLPATWFSMTYNRGGAIFDKSLAPQLGAGYLALHEVNLRGLRTGVFPFAGFANFTRLFHDDVFWLSLGHTLVFVGTCV